LAIGPAGELRIRADSLYYPHVTSFQRRLPHFHEVGQPVFLTWRLHGSLPPHRAFASPLSSGQAFLAVDRLLDQARTGPLHLHRPEIAAVVVEAIQYRSDCRSQYELHAYVVMPNHVHLLITPAISTSEIMQSLKRFTARRANQALGLTGQPFWQDESYDRLVRNTVEFQRIMNYIERNPVVAGLAESGEAFPWYGARPI
jgi:putative transposase